MPKRPPPTTEPLPTIHAAAPELHRLETAEKDRFRFGTGSQRKPDLDTYDARPEWNQAAIARTRKRPR